MTFEQWFHNLYLFAESEGYDLKQLFADRDYNTVKALAYKMKLTGWQYRKESLSYEK